MIDAIRRAKLGLDRGLAGPLEEPSEYFMKSPPVQRSDDIAKQKTTEFISG
jgi:myo-inositol-1-phosphate synthase